MILVGHQPEYLPYLGFFQKVARADHFVLVDHVPYAHKDFQNRNYIRTHRGPLLLTVPVVTKHRSSQAITDVQIDRTLPWSRKHWQSISVAYRKAPAFSKYADELKAVYDRGWVRLADLSTTLIYLMLRWLDVSVPVTRSSTLDLRERKTAMLVEMCRKVGANTYLSGQGARDYVDTDVFRRAAIRHYFCRFEHPVYTQVHGSFIANLSALDLLFNHGDRARDVLRWCIQASPLEE